MVGKEGDFGKAIPTSEYIRYNEPTHMGKGRVASPVTCLENAVRGTKRRRSLQEAELKRAVLGTKACY